MFLVVPSTRVGNCLGTTVYELYSVVSWHSLLSPFQLFVDRDQLQPFGGRIQLGYLLGIYAWGILKDLREMHFHVWL